MLPHGPSGRALPSGCWEAPAGTAERWDRSCSQKHGKWPSGCRKCLVARPPSLWLLPFPSLQRALTDKDERCGVLHAGAVVVTSNLLHQPTSCYKNKYLSGSSRIPKGLFTSTGTNSFLQRSSSQILQRPVGISPGSCKGSLHTGENVGAWSYLSPCQLKHVVS